jgi:hypothetical protein
MPAKPVEREKVGNLVERVYMPGTFPDSSQAPFITSRVQIKTVSVAVSYVLTISYFYRKVNTNVSRFNIRSDPIQ